MTVDEARNIITAITGPVDRPWDTCVELARKWAYPDERESVELAAARLGYGVGSA
jgi:hypothetical protein